MLVTWGNLQKQLENPPLSEQLAVRDYLDNVMVRTSGALVAGYEVRGIASYFASDEERDRGKVMLGALLKAIPEQSMRMQVRFEVVEDLGDLLGSYTAQNHSEREVVNVLDAHRVASWQRKTEEGHYLRPLLHVYLIWDPQVHHRVAGRSTRQKISFSLSAKTAIERSRREHRELLAEFESLLVGIETTMQAAEIVPRRLTDQELFLEARRALKPGEWDKRPYLPGGDRRGYRRSR